MKLITRQRAFWAAGWLVLFSQFALSEEGFDMEFLEWLGQTTELEELGMDIEQWLPEDAQSETLETDEETSP